MSLERMREYQYSRNHAKGGFYMPFWKCRVCNESFPDAVAYALWEKWNRSEIQGIHKPEHGPALVRMNGRIYRDCPFCLKKEKEEE